MSYQHFREIFPSENNHVYSILNYFNLFQSPTFESNSCHGHGYNLINKFCYSSTSLGSYDKTTLVPDYDMNVYSHLNALKMNYWEGWSTSHFDLRQTR